MLAAQAVQGQSLLRSRGYMELSAEQRREAVAALAVLLRPLVEQLRQRRQDKRDTA